MAGLSDCLSRVRGRTKEGPIAVDDGLSERLKRVNARQPLDNGSCYAVDCESDDGVLSAASKTILVKRQCVLGGILVREIAVACSWRERGICRYAKIPNCFKHLTKSGFEGAKKRLLFSDATVTICYGGENERNGERGVVWQKRHLSREEHVRLVRGRFGCPPLMENEKEEVQGRTYQAGVQESSNLGGKSNEQLGCRPFHGDASSHCCSSQMRLTLGT